MKNQVLSATKFKYDYLTNRLFRIEPNSPEYIYEISEENQFSANFGGQGFILGENSWITFTVYEKKIKVFAKFSQNGEVIYYRKEFSLIPLNKLPLVIPQTYREIIVEFTEGDIVIKNDQGQWVKKESG